MIRPPPASTVSARLTRYQPKRMVSWQRFNFSASSVARAACSSMEITQLCPERLRWRHAMYTHSGRLQCAVNTACGSCPSELCPRAATTGSQNCSTTLATRQLCTIQSSLATDICVRPNRYHQWRFNLSTTSMLNHPGAASGTNTPRMR